ncbi:hypothetical protein FGO68_gene8205 [Halteria grandinella]|uniref:Uncharacterized protein n=1 Tax=Halteria grandinella TaxID=5974 RepID=A0A8J8NV67_HALGN|nr:hypothetical protein FGO68_gene8205 [Halteria grandinella]
MQNLILLHFIKKRGFGVLGFWGFKMDTYEWQFDFSTQIFIYTGLLPVLSVTNFACYKAYNYFSEYGECPCLLSRMLYTLYIVFPFYEILKCSYNVATMISIHYILYLSLFVSNILLTIAAVAILYCILKKRDQRKVKERQLQHYMRFKHGGRKEIK